jgi:hypothetical protein
MLKRQRQNMSPNSIPSRRRSSAVTATTRNVLWGRAAGRCQYDCCNTPLIGDLISGVEDRQFGSVAHIVAETPTGPRGDVVRSPLLANDVANLMLLCHVHHKLIDIVAVEAHPEQRLLAMKAEQEARIEIVTGITTDRASHVVRFGAQIGRHESPMTYDAIGTAMLPEYYPAEGRQLIDLEMLGCTLRDDDPAYWAFHRQNLERQFATKVGERLERRAVRHLSVFALAPQPLLILLGRLLGDITPCLVHQLQREPQTWRWKNDTPRIEFRTRRPETSAGSPALVLGLSATIVDDRVHKAIGSTASIWAIEAVAPHNDILKRVDDVVEFRRRLRTTLDQIKAVHGQDTPLHVFPALPVSAAVEVGRVVMPKADMAMFIYDQSRDRGGFVEALRL